MIKLLAYGTLRKGDYNFERVRVLFGNESIKKVDELDVEGFKMYNLGYFPAIYPGEGKIRCDILEVSEKAAEFIRGMELGAGYEERQIDGAKIYVYHRSPERENYPVMESGDWIKESTEKQ